MATTYDELQAEIADFLDNSNPNLVAAIPTFIRDAESKLSRILGCVEQECHTSTLLTPPPSACVMPPGEFEIPHNMSSLQALYRDSTYLWIYYLKTIPALSNTQLSGTDRTDTNWLLQKHPDLYRYQSLTMAEAFLKDDPRVQLWAVKSDEIIAEIRAQDADMRYGGSSIKARTPQELAWYWDSSNVKRQLNVLPLWDFIKLAYSDAGVCGRDYYCIAGDRIKIWPKPEAVA